MSENGYEQFRSVLMMNLCPVLDASKIASVMQAVDISLGNFNVSKKEMQIITANGIPEVVKLYLATKAVANLSMKTLCQYKYKLFNFFGTVKKSYLDITTTDIRIYLYNYKKEHKCSDIYLDNIRITLNSFFEWLSDNEYIGKNPCANVEHIKYQEKKREPLSAYDLEVLRWNCKTIREKALVDFLFSTGCRVSECSDVNLSDINWDARSVIIRHGKGNKMRTVFFNAESELSLQKYLETRADNEEALFVRCRSPHCRLSSRGIENEIHNIGIRCIGKVFPHKLRHTFATSGLKGGMPLDKLQALLGHENPRTTLIYAKQDATDLQREHQRVYA